MRSHTPRQRRGNQAGARLFAQGDPGTSCIVVMSGEIDVSIAVRGRQRHLATLAAGSILGQVGFFHGGRRSATCTAAKDVVLLEIAKAPCERLFATRSPAALKLLAALNGGMIAALREADRRLYQLTLTNRGGGGTRHDRQNAAAVAAGDTTANPKS